MFGSTYIIVDMMTELTNTEDRFSRALAIEIRSELPRHGLNVTSLAARAGMERDVLTTRLTGRTDWRRRELQAVAVVLGLTASELMARAERALSGLAVSA